MGVFDHGMIGSAAAQGAASAQAQAGTVQQGRSNAQSVFELAGSLVDTGQKQLILLLAILVLIAFAHDRFSKPTYTKADEGYLARFPPRFLTSDARYREGQHFYTMAVIGLFLLLTLSGSRVIELLFAGSTGAVMKDRDSIVWPLAVALIMIGIGSAADDTPFGRLEFLMRRHAHQRAFIPNGTRLIARRMDSQDVSRWMLPWSRATLDRLDRYLHFGVLSKLSAYVEPEGGDLKDAKDLVQLWSFAKEFHNKCDDNIQSNPNTHQEAFFARDNRTDQLWENLAKTEFASSYYLACRMRLALHMATKNASTKVFSAAFIEQNEEDLKKLAAQFQQVRDAVKTALSASVEQALKQPVDRDKEHVWFFDAVREHLPALAAFRNDAALFIACGVLSSRENNRTIDQMLRLIGYGDHAVPIRRNWTGYAVAAVTLPTVAVLGYYILLNMFGEALGAWFRVSPSFVHYMNNDVLLAAFNGTCGYLALYMIVSGYRESALNTGSWKGGSFDRMRLLTWSVGFASLFAFLINILTLKPGIGGGGAILYFTLWLQPAAVMLVGALFMLWHLKQAAKTELVLRETGKPAFAPRRSLRLFIGGAPKALLHGMIAFILVFFSTYAAKQSAASGELSSAIQKMQAAYQAFLNCRYEACPPPQNQRVPEPAAGATTVGSKPTSSGTTTPPGNRFVIASGPDSNICIEGRLPSDYCMLAHYFNNHENKQKFVADLNSSAKNFAISSLSDIEYNIADLKNSSAAFVKDIFNICEIAKVGIASYGEDKSRFDIVYDESRHVAKCHLDRLSGYSVEGTEAAPRDTSRPPDKPEPTPRQFILARAVQETAEAVRVIVRLSPYLSCVGNPPQKPYRVFSWPGLLEEQTVSPCPPEKLQEIVGKTWIWDRLLWSEARRETLVAALATGILAFMMAFGFSTAVFVSRCQDLDEYFTECTPEVIRRLAARLGQLTDNGQIKNGLTAELAEPRPELGFTSVQDCMLHEGMQARVNELFPEPPPKNDSSTNPASAAAATVA